MAAAMNRHMRPNPGQGPSSWMPWMTAVTCAPAMVGQYSSTLLSIRAGEGGGDPGQHEHHGDQDADGSGRVPQQRAEGDAEEAESGEV
jgi:hypothetical protein